MLIERDKVEIENEREIDRREVEGEKYWKKERKKEEGRR